MPKILILAKSGFGKTTSWAGRGKVNVKGLDPKETFVIQCVNRAVPNPEYKLTSPIKINPTNHTIADLSVLTTGNRVQVNHIAGLDRFYAVAEILKALISSPYKNIVVDDFNYLAQDFYMANAMKGGWEIPKQIGYGMGLIFESFRDLPEDKNLFCCAHYEEYRDKNGDSISYKFKTTGKMVDDYITPEGKFDIIMFGKQSFNPETKTAVKVFVKEFDGEYPAKDSIGALDSLPNEIPNDLSIIVDKLKEIYG